MLTKRQLQILKAIVESFINKAEPVGSKTLMNEYHLPFSSATIRNEMAALESLGYLEKTHTSSGRIPSSLGYKYYVLHLMESQLDENMKNQLQPVLSNRGLELNDVFKEICHVLSELTNLTSVVLGSKGASETLQKISIIPLEATTVTAIIVTNHGHVQSRTFELNDEISLFDLQNCVDMLNDLLIGTYITEIPTKIEEVVKPLLQVKVKQYDLLLKAFVQVFSRFINDHIYSSGTTNMLYQPEFNDLEKIRHLMEVMNDESFLRQLHIHDDGLSVKIGSENILALEDVTVISSSYHIDDDEKGTIAIIGPTRMKYDQVVGLLEYVSKSIEEAYKKK